MGGLHPLGRRRAGLDAAARPDAHRDRNDRVRAFRQRSLSCTRATSLSFVLLGVVFFGLTSMMLVGFMAKCPARASRSLLMTMHFYMGKVHGYPGWSSHHIYTPGCDRQPVALSPCGARSHGIAIGRWRRPRMRAISRLNMAICGRSASSRCNSERCISGPRSTRPTGRFSRDERLEEAFIWSFTGRALEPLISLGAILAVLAITRGCGGILSWRSPSSCAAGRRSSCRWACAACGVLRAVAGQHVFSHGDGALSRAARSRRRASFSRSDGSEPWPWPLSISSMTAIARSAAAMSRCCGCANNTTCTLWMRAKSPLSPRDMGSISMRA